MSGPLEGINELRKWGEIFVQHALLVLGESEAQAEIDSLKKELDKIIMESNKHALLLSLYGKQEFMHALMDSSHIQESYTQFGNIVNKLESMENQPESPVEVASPEHVEQPTMNVDQT
jgi:hypothetical protein